MSLTDGITLLEDVFIKTAFFESFPFIIPQTIIVIGTLLFITRQVNDWKKISFPVLIGWSVFGMVIHPILFMISGVLLVLEILSVEQIGGVVTSLSNGITRERERWSKGSKENRMLRKGLKETKKSKGTKETFDKLIEMSKTRETYPGTDLKQFRKSDGSIDWRKLKDEEKKQKELEKAKIKLEKENKNKGRNQERILLKNSPINTLGYTPKEWKEQDRLTQFTNLKGEGNYKKEQKTYDIKKKKPLIGFGQSLSKKIEKFRKVYGRVPTQEEINNMINYGL